MRVVDPFAPVHGGEGAQLAARYGLHAGQVIDFSLNVNPLGAPERVKQFLADSDALVRSLASYPDRRARILTRAIEARFGVAEDCIVVGNGSAALLDAVLRAVPATTCLVPVPAFSEYRRAVHAAGHVWQPMPLRDEDDFAIDAERVIEQLESLRPGIAILTNPHNPSGAVSAREALLRILHAAARAGCMLVLDEAFIDYVPEQSIMQHASESSSLIVLRSVTKFYAMPAMRAGYAVTTAALAQRIAGFLPSWPVSTVALECAARALEDPSFDERSIAYNAQMRGDLGHALRQIGVRVLPSAANFLLLELPAVWGPREAVCEELVRSFGIVVRNCADYDGLGERAFVRVGVKDHSSNERLVNALRSIRVKAGSA